MITFRTCFSLIFRNHNPGLTQEFELENTKTEVMVKKENGSTDFLKTVFKIKSFGSSTVSLTLPLA